MPKKKAAGAANAVDLSQVQVCVDRPIEPAKLLIAAELAIKENPENAPPPMEVKPGVDPQAAKKASETFGAVLTGKKWKNGRVLRVRHLDGNPAVLTRVEKFAREWCTYANIDIQFVKTGDAEIRVSYLLDNRSWSYLGTDALAQPQNRHTMHFGWLTPATQDNEYSRVVLHEFGHALGCIHEHQSPTFSRKWNTSAVMRYFQGPPNFWSPDEITHNVLAKYSPTGISATQFDPKSIMLYAFDGALFADGLGPTNTNTKLSQSDVTMIKSMYP